jgi:hypothetical protein
MNFKELLKRYREGTATKEEGELVEKELEKHESIEEYFSEDLSDRFLQDNLSNKEDPGESMGDENLPEEKDLNINRLVNRRLRKVILTSVVIVVLLYLTVFYGISAVVDGMHYDPTTVTKAEEGVSPRTDFHFDMKAYISLNMPGYAMSSFTPVVSEGFGNYEVYYPLRNLLSRQTQNYNVGVSRGGLTYADGGIFDTDNRHYLWEGFDIIRYPGNGEEDESYQEMEIERKNDITLEYLDALNPLSYLSMHMVFEEDLSMMEFYQLSRQHPSLDFKWVGIRTVSPDTRWSENQPMHLIGFNPNTGDEPSSSHRPDPEDYPLFNLNDRWEEPLRSEEEFAEIYETHFHSRLRYLSSREEFIEIFDYNPYKVDFYEESLEYIEQEGIYTYGVVVYGTAEEFSEAVEDLPYESLYIDEVLPAKPNIYY